jgi:outer membrane protein assembly factor BamB
VTSASKIVALDPATGKVLWSDTEVGDIFGPVSAVPGVAFVGTVTNPLGKVSVGKYLALSTSTGKTLWTFTPPAHVGGGASIVDGNLVWGYGFPLFSGAGAGGVIDFTLS